MNTYEQLVVWQKAHDIALDVYKATQSFPRVEVYGLTAQLRRAATSIAANIVEGKSRRHTKEFVQFLNIARGSVGEVHYHLRLAHDLGYLPSSSYKNLRGRIEEVGRMMSALINSML